jgi:RNA polymerase sigma factor (sigma-70 family)
MSGQQDSAEEFLPTRGSLLIRLKDWDDHASWKTFFDTYWKLIYGVAIKSGLSDGEAQDVVQETVLSVARKMNAFKYDPALGSFKGWLLTLTRWRISDQLRKRRRHEPPGGWLPEDPARSATIEHIPDENGLHLETIWDVEWQKNLMDAAISRVKRKVGARQYQLFDLYVIKEWAPEEVASTLGVSVDQVYQAKSRVSAQIRKEVEQLEATML